MTIIEAVIQVMKAAREPMTPTAVASEIQRINLYPFKTKDPLGVVRAQMRRHTQSYDRPAASGKPCLRKVGKDLYVIL
jgi:hypothetical protein